MASAGIHLTPAHAQTFHYSPYLQSRSNSGFEEICAALEQTEDRAASIANHRQKLARNRSILCRSQSQSDIHAYTMRTRAFQTRTRVGYAEQRAAVRLMPCCDDRDCVLLERVIYNHHIPVLLSYVHHPYYSAYYTASYPNLNPTPTQRKATCVTTFYRFLLSFFAPFSVYATLIFSLLSIPTSPSPTRRRRTRSFPIRWCAWAFQGSSTSRMHMN